MINYFIQLPGDDKPMRISGEVLFRAYVSKTPTIKQINAVGNPPRVEIEFSTPELMYAALVIEEGPPLNVTYRSFLSRRRW